MNQGDTVGYAKKFLKQIQTPATDPAWFRRGHIVAIGGQSSPDYLHWKTGQPIPLPVEFVLVRWQDATYPNEDGHNANLVRTTAVAKVGTGRFAEDI